MERVAENRNDAVSRRVEGADNILPPDDHERRQSGKQESQPDPAAPQCKQDRKQDGQRAAEQNERQRLRRDAEGRNGTENRADRDGPCEQYGGKDGENGCFLHAQPSFCVSGRRM